MVCPVTILQRLLAKMETGSDVFKSTKVRNREKKKKSLPQKQTKKQTQNSILYLQATALAA
jgi:hypothetical protein